MSLTSKITLLTASAFSVGIISYVHYKQYSDRYTTNIQILTLLNKIVVFRDKLHQGVLNDIERRQRRKAENVYNLQKQSDLAKDLRKAESSSNDLT